MALRRRPMTTTPPMPYSFFFTRTNFLRKSLFFSRSDTSLPAGFTT